MDLTENITDGAMGETMAQLTVKDKYTDGNISYGVKDEYRMALIGKTGSGKSASGNNILGRKDAFISELGGESVTKKCGFKTAERFGKKLVVVDTPGLFDTSLSNEEITKEIIKCIGILSPGPHAFLLVVQIGRFTPEEKNTIDHFISIFGEEFFKYLIILFTRKDDLENNEKTIHEYVNAAPHALKTILQRCDRKYIAFDNTPRGRKLGEDTFGLIQMMEAIMKETGKAYYSNEMFEEAERQFERRKVELRLAEKKKIEQEKKKIEDQIKAEREFESREFQLKMLELDKREKEIEEKDEKYRETYREECESGNGNIFFTLLKGVGSGIGFAVKTTGSAIKYTGSAANAVGRAFEFIGSKLDPTKKN